MIGSKVEKEFKNEPKTKCWSFHHNSNGGGFGRFLFIIALLLALNSLGKLEGIPSWILILLVIGFSFMKF